MHDSLNQTSTSHSYILDSGTMRPFDHVVNKEMDLNESCDSESYTLEILRPVHSRQYMKMEKGLS